MNITIYDLDGTLRSEDQSHHMRPDDVSKARKWLPWQEHINALGVPITSNVKQYMQDVKTKRVVILTSSQFGTLQWLNEHRLPKPYAIIERQFFDNRPPIIMKHDYIGELYSAGYTIVEWVDNCNEMCNGVSELYNNIEVVRV